MKKHTKSHIERQAEKLGMARKGMESDKAFRVRVGDALAAKSNPRVIKQYKLPGAMGQSETLAELREHKRQGKAPKLYIFVYRNGALNCLPIYNMSSPEIQHAIAQGVAMFERNHEDAEEFQNLCFAELHRRL